MEGKFAWAPRSDLLDCCLDKNIFSPGVPSVGGTGCRVTKEMVLEYLSFQLAGSHPDLGLCEGAIGERSWGGKAAVCSTAVLVVPTRWRKLHASWVMMEEGAHPIVMCGLLLLQGTTERHRDGVLLGGGVGCR